MLSWYFEYHALFWCIYFCCISFFLYIFCCHSFVEKNTLIALNFLKYLELFVFPGFSIDWISKNRRKSMLKGHLTRSRLYLFFKELYLRKWQVCYAILYRDQINFWPQVFFHCDLPLSVCLFYSVSVHLILTWFEIPYMRTRHLNMKQLILQQYLKRFRGTHDDFLDLTRLSLTKSQALGVS